MRVILEGTKGFLFKDGKFIKMLEAGKHSTMFGKQIIVSNVNNSKVYVPGIADVSIFLKDEEFKKQTIEVEAKENELTIHLVDGVFEEVLSAGKYFFWNINRTHSFIRVDLTNPEIPSDFPEYLLTKSVLAPYFVKVNVDNKQKGLLFLDHKFSRVLEPGNYFFTRGLVDVKCVTVDTGLLSLDIVGQEILTSDKVSLRINCVCNYKVTDYVKAITEIDDYKSQLHTYAQLALRDYIGNKTLDDILASKKEMSDYLLKSLKEKEEQLYVSIDDAAVKDIILPGEIRDIMNTVLVAEKRAQANVITRREEVASTRSLLNTARLMDENETLYKLKELEYVERICEKVGNINLNGGKDILTELTTVLSGERKKK